MSTLHPGPIWQKRTRILISALVKQALAEFQGGDSAKGVRMVRHNWQMENGHPPRLEVWATREALSKLAISHNKEGPTPEQVRGILTQFLEKKPLWILKDERINKKGPEAINWYFFLTLWSTDMEENEKQFEQAWVDGKKKEKGHTPEVSAATYELTPLPAPLQATIYENINHQENLNIDQCIIDKLVKVIRNKIKPWIIEHCGKMKVLDMSQPVELENIYTTVNILEQITGRQRVEEVLQKSNHLDLEDFDRFSLGKIKEKNISGLEAVNKYEKLLILGKPGAGKTTFLKYLAIHCINEINEKKWAESVPIFITLKHFAETKDQPDIELFILKLVGNDKITQLLKSGQVLVLLDGLDEVKEVDNDRVLREIQDFTEKFWENKFVLTCRIAAKEYTFERFTEVEIADFNDKQISAFASNWGSWQLLVIRTNGEWRSHQTHLVPAEIVLLKNEVHPYDFHSSDRNTPCQRALPP